MLQTKLCENKILAQIPVKNQGIKNLKNELNLLRSFMISIIGEDKEGNYNPNFIAEMLQAVNEKPVNFFCDSKSFLKELRKI
ncbi:MAG: hypothetical protein ABIC82_01730 [bacterium]